MGTNYYWEPPAPQLSDELQVALDMVRQAKPSSATDDEWATLVATVLTGRRVVLRLEEWLHIGKSSMGWAFSMRCYKHGAGPKSLEEWREKLASGGVIRDEYGETVPLDEFWDIAERRGYANREHLWRHDSGTAGAVVNLKDVPVDLCFYEFS
jgi:hypothetical protein